MKESSHTLRTKDKLSSGYKIRSASIKMVGKCNMFRTHNLSTKSINYLFREYLKPPVIKQSTLIAAVALETCSCVPIWTNNTVFVAHSQKYQVIVICVIWNLIYVYGTCFILSHYSPLVCVSPCSLHSLFSHHLLRGAAATSQHIRHVHLCVV